MASYSGLLHCVFQTMMIMLFFFRRTCGPIAASNDRGVCGGRRFEP